MKKHRMTALILILSCLLPLTGASGEGRELETEIWDLLLPENAPVYEMIYEYPHLTGEDNTAVMINDSFDTARYEMTDLLMPMLAALAGSEDGSLSTARQTYTVPCNDERFLSFLFRRKHEKDGIVSLTLEGSTYDIGGEYAGQTLTLRGVVMVGESTVQIVHCLMPVLYERFCDLQEQGIVAADWTEEDFYDLVAPDTDFYTNADHSVTFFLQPEMMTEPSFDVPCFTFTAEELAALLN